MRHGRAVAPWSDAATWGGRLPRAGESVVIPDGRRVLLDVSPPPLKGLQVDGLLLFDDRDLSLSADWILVRGELRIGAANRPFTRRAVIRLTGDDPRQNVWGLGTKFLAVMGDGAIELHGEWRDSRAKLDAAAEAGSAQLLVDHIPGWRPGDRVVVGLRGSAVIGAEGHTVAAVSRNALTLDRPLKHNHWGMRQTYLGTRLDHRVEVGLLTHNIVIRGEDAQGEGFGGCVTVLRHAKMRLSGVEATGLGQPGRYPIHVHVAGDPASFWMTNSSLHHNFQPGLATAGLSYRWLLDNVVWNGA
jgi:cell migration-inducing and hyaluronan-binding protein